MKAEMTLSHSERIVVSLHFDLYSRSKVDFFFSDLQD